MILSLLMPSMDGIAYCWPILAYGIDQNDWVQTYYPITADDGDSLHRLLSGQVLERNLARAESLLVISR